MKKKLLALLCVLSILVGVFAVVAKAEATGEDDPAQETFQVGYAKVDINPYWMDDEGDIQTETVDGKVYQKIMPVPLRGTGSSASRLAYEKKIDDNGDGKVDGEDGLFLTCIAITDSSNNTVLMFTMDAIGDMGHTNLAKTAIVKELGKTYGITSDRIIVSGTHAHGGVDLKALTADLKISTNTVNVEKANGETVGVTGAEAFTYLNEWQKRLVGYERIVEFDENGEVITNKNNYVNAENYFVQAAREALNNCAAATVKKGQFEASTASGKVMNSVRHYSCDEGYVFSDNSNPVGSNPQAVSEVDQTMHVIYFDFEENEDIVLANWRGHPSLNSVDPNKYAVTSDYVNAFRYTMKQAGYRAVFFQGAGGNNNPTSKVAGQSDWIVADAISGLRGNTYGSALADVVCQHLIDGETMNSVRADGISTLQEKYKANVRRYTEDSVEYKAAQAAIEAYNSNSWFGSWDGNSSDPYKYRESFFGEVKYCIASLAHANTIIGYTPTEENNVSETTTLEINAILLGSDIAIVTTPGEAFDRYGDSQTENLWDNLLGENLGGSYGEPLIFGYTNQHIGYIPNSLSYEYNKGSKNYAEGCYESQITPLAQGEGEIMVEKLEGLLNDLVNPVTEVCEACGKEVEWYQKNSGTATEHGHYYLTENVDGVAQTTLSVATTVCLDLNGYTMTCEKRAFEVANGAGSTLNIMDTSENKTGKLVGTGAEMSGGTIYLDQGNYLNVYSGTITCDTSVKEAQDGGVIYTKSKVNIYGGKIEGCSAKGKGGAILIATTGSYMSDQVSIYGGEIIGGTTGGNGSAICLSNTPCGLSVYGGVIKAGSIKEGGTGTGNCVAVDYGRVILGGDAQVDEIRYNAIPSTTTYPKFDIVSSKTDAVIPFTGKVTLNIPAITDYTKPIGKSTVEWGAGSKVTIADGTEVYMTENLDIVTQAPFTKDDENVIYDAVVYTGSSKAYHDSLDDAISHAALQGYVVLGKDVTEPLTVNQNVTIDLNGKNIDTLNVAEGVVVQIRDRMTDDYFVGDHIYGVIGEVTGKGQVVGAENYLAIKDAETKSVSAHCYKAEINKVVLSSSKAGMYYKSEFKGDAVVKQNIETFGVAVSLDGEPNKDNLRPDNHSAFAAEEFGEEGTSTVLVNIMSTVYESDDYNNSRAQIPVCGSAYIKLKDGTYRFSTCQEKSLKETVQDLDEQYDWNDLEDAQKKDLMDMYNRFSSVMDDWNIGVINDGLEAEAKTLKVLVLDDAQPVDAFDFDAIIGQAGLDGEEFTSHQVGVLWSEGCTMAQHKANAQNDTKYSYSTKVSEEDWVGQASNTLKAVLKSDKWDVIVLPETSDTNAQYVKNFVKRTLGYTPIFVAEQG